MCISRIYIFIHIILKFFLTLKDKRKKNKLVNYVDFNPNFEYYLI